jgi:hypothetical protein
MMRRLAALFGVALLAATAAMLAGPAARAEAPGPALPEPTGTLDAALHCPSDLTRGYRGAVLLVPGTGLSGPENWDWGYRPALEAEGFVVCTVDMRDFGMGDIQVSAGRIVHAVRTMHAATGQKVALVGYSQGGLDIRWALKYWPDIRAMVSDVIGLAPANHGADSAAAICQATGACPASIWQMVPGSRLIRAVNAGGETFAGIDYTVIYSRTDGVVIPPAERSSLRGAGVANIELQALCPSSTLAHIGFPADGAVYALVRDALLRPGPADAARVNPAVCGTLVPGVAADVAAAKATELTNLATARIFGAPPLPAEPPLASYAAADAPPAPRPPSTGTGAGSPAPKHGTLALGAMLAATGLALMATGWRLRRAAQRRVSSM